MQVKIILNEDLKKDVSEITMTKYEDKLEDIECLIKDLISYYYNLEEEFEDYKEYVKDNYKIKSPYELYGISEEDFI